MERILNANFSTHQQHIAPIRKVGSILCKYLLEIWNSLCMKELVAFQQKL